MERIRELIRVEGVVQGVGFRPFVHTLATRSGLSGLVGNDAGGVFIEVEGDAGSVAEFRTALSSDAPPLAVVECVRSAGMELTGAAGFVIEESRVEGARRTRVPPDTATCPDCRTELFDPSDRRYRYPFINCTNCGPRFTIVRDVPYDRPYTTMSDFAMCAACATEYADPEDRRFHAQPLCCPACGPVLSLYDHTGRRRDGDPVRRTAEALRARQVVAVKGIGGYHLAADAASPVAVGALRERKHREDKAFAVMVADMETARTLCHIDQDEERVLTGFRRPIVLLRRRQGAPIADQVAPGNRDFGLMLAYTPVHHLLAAELGGPFVLTSANVSDEPIAYRDEDAFARLAGIADLFLTHDRPIHTRTDDSVVRVFRGGEVPVRRSRGYVPQPLEMPLTLARPLLACGAELKNTFCLAAGDRAFLSHHIGDLENYETLRSFTEGIEHFRKLFQIDPALVVHDLHPEYLSTKYALERDGVDLLGVQHHHAHIAACLADNGERGPVIGVVFDGLGYGSDGQIWGGEFLVAELSGFRRAGHLDYVPMPGGAAAITEPWRMAVAYLDAAYGDEVPDDLEVVQRNRDRWGKVRTVARAGTAAGMNAPRTSSAGRLFDAVAAVVGVRDRVNYEGQAAVELEQLAYRAEPVASGYTAATVTGGDVFSLRGADLVRAAVEDMHAGTPTPIVAARFHKGVTDLIATGCARVRESTGLDTVALSGGVFQNRLLLDATVLLLEQHGFRVLVHSRVPGNDGGISLGQTAVAAALDTR